MASYESILAPLDSLAHLVRRPLDARALSELETAAGVKAPPGVRAWLMHVGLFQDVTAHADFDFELLDSRDEIIESRRALDQILGPDRTAGLFPFGDDGAGDVIAVRRSGDGSDEIVFVDHETGQVASQGRFEDWLTGVVRAAMAAPPGSAGKKWCVQFGFKTRDAGVIFDALRSIATVEVDERAWTSRGTSPAGVSRDELPFRLNGGALILSRLRYDGWSEPRFSFDLQEPAFVPIEGSFVARLDALFKAHPELGYQLVDYGPLDVDAPDEQEDRDAAPTGAAGFFRRLGAMFRT